MYFIPMLLQPSHFTNVILNLLQQLIRHAYYGFLVVLKFQLILMRSICSIRNTEYRVLSKPRFWHVEFVLLFFLVLCCAIMFLYVLSSMLWCPLRFPHKNDLRFVFTSSCLCEPSCLIYVICVCLRIVVSNIYCVVCLLCFSSSCAPYVASFSVLSIFDCPVYLLFCRSYIDGSRWLWMEKQ
jgi:hypothetical protein